MLYPCGTMIYSSQLHSIAHLSHDITNEMMKNIFLLPRPRSHEASPYIEPDCADCSLRFRPHALRSEERLSQFLADLSDVLFDFLHQFQFRVRRSHLLQRNTQDWYLVKEVGGPGGQAVSCPVHIYCSERTSHYPRASQF